MANTLLLELTHWICPFGANGIPKKSKQYAGLPRRFWTSLHGRFWATGKLNTNTDAGSTGLALPEDIWARSVPQLPTTV